MRPKYRIIIEKGNEELTVQEIALVDSPAVEIDFLYFNKVKKPLYFNEEKMIVAGPLMIPDRMIYRYDDEMGEYDVFFTKEDIDNARFNFKKFGMTGAFNEGHTDKKINVVLIEDYILKANDERVSEYGFQNLPEGTWFGISKVDDYETWNKVKSGELRGFSVEGLFQLRETFSKKSNFIVEPTPAESKDDFVSRCIAVEIGNGMPEDRAAAVCYAKWDEEFGLENLFKFLTENEVGSNREEFNFDEYDVFEGNFEWEVPDWMKPTSVMYYYDAKPGAIFDAAGIIDSRSRRFCINMVNSGAGITGKVYSIDDINKMSGAAGFDVFMYAGGKNCRHTWYTAIPKTITMSEEFKSFLNDKKINISQESDINNITEKNKNSKMRKTVKTVEKFVIETELKNGTEVIVNADELVEGAEVSVKVDSETETYERTPDGEHILADGTTITTEGGKITSITPPAESSEESPEEIERKRKMMEEDEMAKKKYKMEITEEDLVVIMDALQPKFDEMMSMIAELASKITTSEEEAMSEEGMKEEKFNKTDKGLSRIDKIMVLKERFGIK